MLPLFHQLHRRRSGPRDRARVDHGRVVGGIVMTSIITPAFNEAANLDGALQRARRDDGGSSAWTGSGSIVDDHSRDETFAVVEQLARRDPRVRGVRLARNSGSHVAITCGLHHGRGDAAVMMAADLQDPPETLGAMLERWRGGAQVVWAVRRQRPGERRTPGFAAIYYWIMRRVVGLTEMPARGADFFLIDRVVIDAFRQFSGANVERVRAASRGSVSARSRSNTTSSRARAGDPAGRWRGRSSSSSTRWWRFPTSRSAGAPTSGVAAASAARCSASLRRCCCCRRSVAALLLVAASCCRLDRGPAAALGIVGEYVWRALDEARRRPAYAIEAVAGQRQASGWPGIG